MKFAELMKKERVLMDGAMGTVLYEIGLDYALPLETISMENRGSIIDVHKAYIAAGSDMIFADTFGVNRTRLWNSAIGMETLMVNAMKNAKKAAKLDTVVGFYISPIGGFYAPAGDITEEYAYEYYKTFAVLGETEGAGVVLLENFWDLRDAQIAITAVKENTNLPVMASMCFFARNEYNLSGFTVKDTVRSFESFGVDVVGLSCSPGIERAWGRACEMADAATVPLMIKPNAQTPDLRTMKYEMTPERFAELMRPYVEELNFKFIGGCCGTTPEHIRLLKEKLL